MAKDAFIYPLIYIGGKDEKDVASALGSLVPVVFRRGPLSSQPGPLEGQRYCDVSEKDGRTLVKRFPELFRWPEGTQLGPQVVTREEFDALAEVVANLAASLAELRGGPVVNKGGRPKKEAADVALA